MELIQPGLGLFFWMLLSFSIVLWILKKFAWKPILKAIKDREESIDESLRSAEKAKDEMIQLKANNEKILNEARSERDALLKDARGMKDKIIAEAKEQASEQANEMIVVAKEAIRNEKAMAINEIKDKITSLSIDIAEKILKESLKDKTSQERLIQESLNDIKLN